MTGPSLRSVGYGVIELLIRNKKVTDRRADMHNAICTLFVEIKCCFEFENLQETSIDALISVAKIYAQYLCILNEEDKRSISL